MAWSLGCSGRLREGPFGAKRTPHKWGQKFRGMSGHCSGRYGGWCARPPSHAGPAPAYPADASDRVWAGMPVRGRVWLGMCLLGAPSIHQMSIAAATERCVTCAAGCTQFSSNINCGENQGRYSRRPFPKVSGPARPTTVSEAVWPVTVSNSTGAGVPDHYFIQCRDRHGGPLFHKVSGLGATTGPYCVGADTVLRCSLREWEQCGRL